MPNSTETSLNGPNALYHYNPSLPASAIFIALFALTTLLHNIQLFITKTWFLTPLLIGGLFEVVGYIGRLISHTETPDWSLGIFIMQSFTILLAPTLFSASIYMGLSRIIRSTGREELCIVRVKWLSKLFVLGDIISFLVQGQGAGILSKKSAPGKDNMKTGSAIIVAGLLIQLLFFALFVLVALNFDGRLRRATAPLSPSAANITPYPYYRHLLALYFASLLIFTRNVFRVVEYVQGNNGYILRHEWFLFVFDGALMVVLMAGFNVVHPSQVDANLKGGRFVEGGWRVGRVEKGSVGGVRVEEEGREMRMAGGG